MMAILFLLALIALVVAFPGAAVLQWAGRVFVGFAPRLWEAYIAVLATLVATGAASYAIPGLTTIVARPPFARQPEYLFLLAPLFVLRLMGSTGTLAAVLKAQLVVFCFSSVVSVAVFSILMKDPIGRRSRLSSGIRVWLVLTLFWGAIDVLLLSLAVMWAGMLSISY